MNDFPDFFWGFNPTQPAGKLIDVFHSNLVKQHNNPPTLNVFFGPFLDSVSHPPEKNGETKTATRPVC